jgi:hypothetical protein
MQSVKSFLWGPTPEEQVSQHPHLSAVAVCLIVAEKKM